MRAFVRIRAWAERQRRMAILAENRCAAQDWPECTGTETRWCWPPCHFHVHRYADAESRH